MNLHLFSLPGEHPLQDIVIASRPFLVAEARPIVLYLPAAGITVEQKYVDLTRSAFRGLAEVEVLDLTRPVSLVDLRAALGRASVLYVPGGNTYLLLQRLYRNEAVGLIQTRVQAGMPLVGFSAGLIICGENILTTNDINCCASTQFVGLGFTKHNFAAHYPGNDIDDQEQMDSRIREYHAFHANPVLALEDDGYIEIDGGGVKVVHGHCWLFEAGREKRLVQQGYIG